MGSRTIFNLYGDVNQLIYDYKGITDWEDLQGIVSNEITVLNENYRNTVQITDYCNERFEAGITAIGLSGEPVKELNIDAAFKEFASVYKNSPGIRAAVIHKRGLADVHKEIQKRLLNDSSSVDLGKISVLTVEEAKGLEFEMVLVVNNLLDVNEEYISFTRALDHLIITGITDQSMEVVDDTVEAEDED